MAETPESPIFEQRSDDSAAAPESWSRPAPDSWTHQPAAAPSPAPGPWPGQESQQPLPPPGLTPPAADYPFPPPPGQPGPFNQPGPFSGQPGAAYPLGQFPPGQFPVGQYGYSAPFYLPVAPRNNPFAITALVLGLVQLLGFFVVVGNVVCAVPAIIFGSIALRQIRQRGERGRGMAIAGVVLGIAGVVLFVLIIILIAIGLSVQRGSGSGGVSG